MPPKYYLPHLVKNPFVSLKYQWLDRRQPLPDVPKHIQIETVAGCNANCVFCPNKKTETKTPLGQRMDWDLYRSLVPLQKTLDNIDRLLELKRSGGYKLPRIRVCMLLTKVIEPQREKILAYWGSRGVKVNFNQLENRGGHQAIQSDALAARELQQFDWCNRLFEQMYIAYDGRALMCCADWEYRGVMGDTNKDPLKKIWTNFRYGCFRERFLTGHIQGMLCDGCTKDSVGNEDED